MGVNSDIFFYYTYSDSPRKDPLVVDGIGSAEETGNERKLECWYNLI